ncbi:bifunctional 4-hydroxy-2-oxoglutarate aldolase/2-dehydro-3-deoxy-phosphogluconate aldolase [Conexibacter sp. JD483]|uniref:bifunctional 4-hydroxy-2-oxoglutarate aldolase/2-dehydro-3-deoxy-phosphogluconate aldolase n=1 Tax=unclassified Conexibacter TaxID=2627773 RepID=UPI0027284A66|nr:MULTISPECIES: bifunctional 4-hydroxy-2-oxoglutarate aldolase/2-dehydro-3-deoxy-phosphogluconate aldolase [unclassified Conexibacter]MDO8187548.1 bifunctional 4-hydroxy-2-oxoglutarate aldolase/2-dehydro-3-deoxy-phosphogluconate aldolase [Conexibacter sp. CPCC 205706]MDO8198914.1 bifunctional 4-hydroxy-2-oxoglutarate aldolase/2-dehydro-3-deoxy-phosphogluconate aldolase [Conexibacter sp. CPCC 205762]MDR9372939.1 bifunctional 4-hydroxy-2-oxoglutarate aldolase/2-dehydro-3-deoxy-phosphogluconate al
MSAPAPAGDAAGLAQAGIVAVLRGPSPEAVVAAGGALLRGGVRALEVTFTTPGAALALRELRARHGDELLLGAGTLRRPAQVEEAVAAGARFLVSPGLDGTVLATMGASGLPTWAGVCTPTEVMRATAQGLTTLKLFPAGVGGVALLRALREPFPEVSFMPTGGVTVANLGEWLAAGAVAVGAGGSLCPAAELAEGAWEAIERRAREFGAALSDARSNY